MYSTICDIRYSTICSRIPNTIYTTSDYDVGAGKKHQHDSRLRLLVLYVPALSGRAMMQPWQETAIAADSLMLLLLQNCPWTQAVDSSEVALSPKDDPLGPLQYYAIVF